MLENKVNEDQVNENEGQDFTPNVAESTGDQDESARGQNDHAGTTDEGNRGQDDHGSGETVSEGDSNETFPRDYVEKLRKENAKYRERAQQSDELAHKLHAALVKLDGRLADPEDLEFDPEHLEDGDALSAAISDLVARKPGLKAQQLAGDVGQGKRGSDPKPEVDLISIMRKLQ